jgi:hypothetical protein
MRKGRVFRSIAWSSALLIAGWVTVSEAAAPRLVMVYGSLLDKPAVIDDWIGIEEKLYWCQGLCSVDGKVTDGRQKNDIEPADLKGRPYLDLALFWGTPWVQYVNDGKPLGNIKAEDAEATLGQGMQSSAAHGKFYPACGDLPAVIWLYTIKRVNEDGLKLLSKFGVPIRTECR